MAEHIHKTFSCDRCGTSLGDKRPPEKMHVAASKEGEWAMEFKITWKDFCVQCERDVTEFFRTPVARQGDSDV